MDTEFIVRLKKSLDDIYLVKLSQLLNTKEDSESSEAKGFIKAIKRFGELIEENIEKAQ